MAHTPRFVAARVTRLPVGHGVRLGSVAAPIAPELHFGDYWEWIGRDGVPS